MSRFRPTVESLDERALPSAVFASADDYTPPTTQMVQVADTSGDAGDVGGQTESVAKVRFQDFNFTSKVSKSSPLLM